MNPKPKYVSDEIERRWLVDLSAMCSLDGLPCVRISDNYIAGTRLRLRRIDAPGAETVFKFCRKYGKTGLFTEPITNLYLNETEYRVLSQLPCSKSVKQRYSIENGSLDVYDTPHAGLAIFEVEFISEEAAGAYGPPSFVRAEITGDQLYSGASLSASQA